MPTRARIRRVSLCRRQAFIEAPVPVVWELIADIENHPEWWPRVIDVECDAMPADSAAFFSSSIRPLTAIMAAYPSTRI